MSVFSTARRRGGPALLAGVVALGACDDQMIVPPPVPTVPSAGAMFQSYVAIGNSITAGFQSGGINDSTQLQSYAVLLAEQMGHEIGTTFNVPLMNRPGCPAPYVNVFTQERVSSLPCLLRQAPLPDVLHNVAVPGAGVIDPISNLAGTSDPNALTTFFLGGRTQLQAAAAAAPTFVTVFIGNNDVLGAVLDATNPGDMSLVTDSASFRVRYQELIDSLDAMGTVEGGVLLGVVQAGFAPYLTSGPAWAGFETVFDAQSAPLNALDVNANCSASAALPGGITAFPAIPFPVGGALLQEASAKLDSVVGGTLNPAALVPATVDCSVTQAVTLGEMVHLIATVAAYNATIAAAAQSLGWVFVDPNDLLLQLLGTPGAIRPFPAFPGTDPDPSLSITAPFGTAISRDGVHPSASTHRAVANALIQAINTAYQTSIPPVP